MANDGGTTVSEFVTGTTSPSATLTGVDNPSALAFDTSGDLYVANNGGSTVSEFAAGTLFAQLGTPAISMALASAASAPLATSLAPVVISPAAADAAVRQHFTKATAVADLDWLIPASWDQNQKKDVSIQALDAVLADYGV